MRTPSYLRGGMILITVILTVILISVTGSFGFWLTVAIFSSTGIFLLGMLCTMLKRAIVRPERRLYAKDFTLKFMAALMGLLLVVGALLYIFVFSKIAADDNLKITNAEYLFRSLICSLDLFMLDVDSNLLDRLDDHEFLKGWLLAQATVSFSCTVAMLVALVYSRMNAYFRLHFLTRIDNGRNHLYLFFGNNTPSELLIRDIVRNDPKAVPVIIDEAEMKEDDSEWDGIVGLLAHKQKVFKTASKIGAYVTIASRQPAAIDRDVTDSDGFDLFSCLGIPGVRRLIGRLARTVSPELHIFFLGENEERNIRNIIVLAKDKTILDVSRQPDMKQRIYCHARHNGPNRVIEDVALAKNLEIKIVDSSHIAVELLKLDSENHPVNVVRQSPENPGTVDSPLTTLIVGFGEVGRDAFRFLYEYGALVDSRSTATETVKSPFECIVVDRNMAALQGAFKAMMPGIFRWVSYNRDRISFVDTDYNHDKFYRGILDDDFLRRVNYIVISIGNNDEAVSLAGKIFTMVRRVRDDLSDLRIYVRCTDDEKVEAVENIAAHYNFGYGDREKNTPVIRIFGQPEKTYTYDLVVSDRLIREGRIFQEEYRRVSGGGQNWEQRRRNLIKDGNDIDKLRKLRRQESQDLANALHKGTKLILLRRAMEQIDGDPVFWRGFYAGYFNPDGTANSIGSMTSIRYPALSDAENRLILNLAMLEHLRWNAAHELMGYVFNDKEGEGCDERTMRHNCLCSWQQLDRQSSLQQGWICDYKKYDFCVVDTTIALARPLLLPPRPVAASISEPTQGVQRS
ncbi:MAG: hypothetical protein NC336_06530 [Clostridium sp.]|nr:hypothetical protein [Clostridium sp.]